MRIVAGQELTHLRLEPGEEVRTPLTVLLFWDGNVLQAQNLWRRWMLAYNLPRRQGKLPPPISALCAGLRQSEAIEKGYIDLLDRNDAKLDYWWMDAGWYPGTPGPMGEWTQAGTWKPDAERFPGGIKAVAEFAHAREMRLVLWFELERVSPGSDWSQRPEWLLALRPEDRRFRLGGTVGTPEFAIEEAERNQIREDDRLFNLGNPQAQRFLTDYVSQCITDWGIDLFRLDFNISPLLFWRAADASDRQGLTENKYVCGLLALFRQRLAEWRSLADYCSGDYYPLSAWHNREDDWLAWQFHRPEPGDGVIQAFRRGQCADSTKTFRLSGLDPAAKYELTNFDVEGTTQIADKELSEKGLIVEIKDKPGTAVIVYKRASRKEREDSQRL